MADAAWPTSPLVKATDLHGRDVPYPYFQTEWTSEDEFAYPIEVDSVTFGVELDHGATTSTAEFRIGVDLVNEDGNKVEEIHALASYYVNRGESRTVTLAVTPTQEGITRFKVTVQVLADRSLSGSENWYDPQSRVFTAAYLPLDKINNCPIRRAAYGSRMSRPVQYLREVRDKLSQSRFKPLAAKVLVRYYKLGSPIVGAMERSRLFGSLTKYTVIWPLVIVLLPIAYVLMFYLERDSPIAAPAGFGGSGSVPSSRRSLGPPGP